MQLQMERPRQNERQEQRATPLQFEPLGLSRRVPKGVASRPRAAVRGAIDRARPPQDPAQS